MRTVACVLSMVFLGCGSQVEADQRAARRLCGLPNGSPAKSWTGYPATAGFGQREGLSVSGEFELPVAFLPAAHGYHALPWPQARAAAESSFRSGALLDGATWARCETAGDDVLSASHTRLCDSVPTPNDLILCVLGPDPRSAHVVIRSAY